MTERSVFAGQHVRADLFNADREVLFVTFDHWQRGKAEFSDRRASDTVARAGFAELAIRTARNDWYLNDDLAAVGRALKAATRGYDAVRCFAFSMGAYAALLLSKPLRLSHAVLISPQWSIFPDQAPHDRRYHREAAGLDARMADLTRRIAPDLRGVILFDPVTQGIDARQAGLIAAAAPGLALVAMAFGGHPASSHLADGGQYAGLRKLAYGGVSDVADYRDLHVRARRTSALYAERRRVFIARRAARLHKDEVGSGDQ